MTVRLLVATNNPGKLKELRHLFQDTTIEVVSPADAGLRLDVVEDAATFEGNALLKAKGFAAASGLHAMADDSGLCVDALHGAPGVHSARYAGPGATDAKNNLKLLQAMAGVADEERTARFRCALSLVDPSGAELTRHAGACEGWIARAPQGEGGFGYDPLFHPDAWPERSMAQLSPAEKSAISHRGHATRSLLEWVVAGGF